MVSPASMARSDDRVDDTESNRVATTRVRPGSEVAISRYWGPLMTWRRFDVRTEEPTVVALASGR